MNNKLFLPSPTVYILITSTPFHPSPPSLTTPPLPYRRPSHAPRAPGGLQQADQTAFHYREAKTTQEIGTEWEQIEALAG